MKNLSLLICVLLSFQVFSQNTDSVFVTYKGSTDTLIKTTSFEPNILFETSWLRNSKNIMKSRAWGISTKSVSNKCTQERSERALNSLQFFNVTDTTFDVQYKVIENCCHSFICDVEVSNDSTINFIYHNYGNNCGCNCLHELNFSLGYNFMLDKERQDSFDKIKFITLNGELKQRFK